MKDVFAYALLGLRASLGALFGYFGVLAVLDPARQQAQWVAAWILELPVVGSVEFIFAWGVFQLLLALALILGVYLRFAGVAAAVALLGITVSVGLNDIGYRDVVLAFGALVVASYEHHRWALKAR